MSNTSAKKEKILVIEGINSLGENISNALNSDGYSVVLVKNGTEGLKAIYDVLPQLVIIDLAILESESYDILDKKHDDVMLSKIPVFVLSTQGAPINLHRAREGSVTDFIATIGSDLTDLLNKINTYFGHPAIVVTDNNEQNKGKKILWVEDDKLIGTILKKKFISAGFDIFLAHNGEAAFNYLKDAVPDIIILDLMLPGMDGFDILLKIKAEKDIKNIPVLILSNLSKASDLERAKLLGATKFMTKASSSLDQIINEVKVLIG